MNREAYATLCLNFDCPFSDPLFLYVSGSFFKGILVPMQKMTMNKGSTLQHWQVTPRSQSSRNEFQHYPRWRVYTDPDIWNELPSSLRPSTIPNITSKTSAVKLTDHQVHTCTYPSYLSIYWMNDGKIFSNFFLFMSLKHKWVFQQNCFFLPSPPTFIAYLYFPIYAQFGEKKFGYLLPSISTSNFWQVLITVEF